MIGKEILDYAKACAPEECCGVVIEKPDGSHKFIKINNVSPNPCASFIIDSTEMAKYIDETILIVHSHVNGPPKPSDADIASSERCGIPYYIVGIPDGSVETYYPRGHVVQYENREFVYGVFDCFGLVKDYYFKELGIKLKDRVRPAYEWWKDKKHNNFMINEAEDWGFERVNDLQKHDVIVCQNDSDMPNHLMIYVDDNRVLHHPESSKSRVACYGDYYRKNTRAILRYKDFNNNELGE